MKPRALLIAVGITACSATGSGTQAPGSDLAGARRITFVDPDGELDSEWIYVAPGPPDAPIVVIAHGQGSEHVVNCWPNEAPHDATVKQAAALADRLAEEGFTAVAIAYRNAGSGQPVLPAIRMRDIYVRDAAAVLAAARDVRDRRGGDGETPVAFVGGSNGTFAAWWAATDRPELAELQRGLAIETLVLAGHSGNALANLVAVRPALTGDKTERQRAILLGTMIAVSAAVQRAGVPELEVANLDDGSAIAGELMPLLTPDGIDAFRRVLTTPVAAARGACRSGVPVACDTGCVEDTFADSQDPGAPSTYVTEVVVDAIDAWNPEGPTVLDTSNPVVAATREVSPPFYGGRVRTPRGLVLYSANDHVTNPQGSVAREAALTALRAQGAAVPASPAIAADATAICEHGDYFEPMRGCGYREIVAELHAAFGR